MKKILLPTDFSENAYNAIRYAVQFFKKESCTFFLLNSIHNADFIMHSSLYDMYQKLSQEGLQNLEQRIEEEFPNPLHSFKRVSTFNLLHEEIKERVNNKQIDLIVISSRGDRDGGELLFGSNTAHAIRIAKCPILTVPTSIKYSPIEQILFPSDFKLTLCELQLSFLKETAENNKSKINILHECFGQEITENQENVKNAIDDYFAKIPHSFQESSVDSVMDSIYQFKEKYPVQLLAMVKNKHSFIEKILFRSTVKEVAFYIKLPFLILPSEHYEV